MRRGLPVAADALLATLALAWPLECFTFVPSVDVYLGPVLGALLVPVLLAHALVSGRLRLPFELAVPWLLALALAVWRMGVAGDGASARIALALVVFAAAVHFRIPPRAQRRYLWLTIAGTTASAGLAICGWLAGWMPTAYSLETGAQLYFAYDVGGGSVTLLAGFALALGVAVSGTTPMVARVAAGLAAIVAGSAFATVAGMALPLVATTHPEPRFIGAPLSNVALSIVLLYGVARTIAKVEVAREERPSSLHGVYLIVLLVGACALVMVPVLPRVGYGLVAGLACAASLPAFDEGRLPRFGLMGCAVPLALVVLNVVHVNGASTYDGRNYDVALARDLDKGSVATAHRRLDFIEEHAPDEPKAHWWRAHALLLEDRPMRAVTEFAASLEPSGRSLLPAPDSVEREAFLIQLRDRESSTEAPHEHYAYARALVAMGETDEALALLRLQARKQRATAPDMASGPLADGIAFLLNAPELRERLESEWSAGELLAVLRNWRAEVTEAPAWFGEESLPVVLAGTIGLETSRVLVSMPGDRDVQEQPFDVELAPGPVDSTSYWTAIFGDARRWVVEWVLPSQGRGPARITGRNTEWDLLTYEATLVAIPEEAALTVWIPGTPGAPSP